MTVAYPDAVQSIYGPNPCNSNEIQSALRCVQLGLQAPCKMRWDDGQLRFTRQVHGTGTMTIRFQVQNFTLRVMVLSPNRH